MPGNPNKPDDIRRRGGRHHRVCAGRVLANAALAWGVVACGDEAPPGASGSAPYANVEGAPATVATTTTMAATATTTTTAGVPAAGGVVDTMPIGATVERLGRSGGGTLLAAAGGRVYELAGDKLEIRALYAAGSDPVAFGSVHAIAPRAAGGAWLAADAGLFVVDGLFVTKSPLLGGSEGSTYGVAEVATGPASGLWIATAKGLFRKQGDTLHRYTLPPLAAPARAVAADATSGGVFVVMDSALVLLRAPIGAAATGGPATLPPANGALATEVAPFATGKVGALAAGAGILVAATASGLVRWSPASRPAWSRFTLAPAAAPPVVPRALAVDLLSPVVWASTERALLRVHGLAGSAYELPPANPPTSAQTTAVAPPSTLAIDLFGDVWIDRGAELVRLSTGARPRSVTFDADVKPWIAAQCVRCHADFSDPAVFAAKAEAAFHRVRTGDMPRCEGGVPCPADKRLGPDQHRVLEDWIRGGKPR